jgi:hypothetical protein
LITFWIAVRIAKNFLLIGDHALLCKILGDTERPKQASFDALLT